MGNVVKIFIVYGGTEGKGYGKIVNDYFKKNNIGSFLASRESADMHAGAEVQSRIDDNLVKSEIAIIIVTPELENSVDAMSEIYQIQNLLPIPYIPYIRKNSPIPTVLQGIQNVIFDPSCLDDNELKKLELEMWRTFDIARTTFPQTSENQTVEVSYIG